MVLEKLRDWNTKRKIKSNKELSEFAMQHARRILEERRPELLQELRKTVREELIKYGQGKGCTLVSIGTKKRIDPILYHRVDDYYLEIGHHGDIANFTYKKIGKTMLLSDLAVGRYYGQSNLRRLGIAKLMVDIAKEIAQREGLAAIRIGSDPQALWLIEMYKKFGFVVISERSTYAEMLYFLDENIKAKFDPKRPWEIFELLK